MTHPPDLTATLCSWAREARFDRAGVASLEPLDHGEVFLRWLERGEHAGMGYLARRAEERLDPAAMLEGARSVLCVALVYHPLAAGEAEAQGEGGPAEEHEPAGTDRPGVGPTTSEPAPGPTGVDRPGNGASAPETAPRPTGDLWPRVARYARGRDYHNLMGKRLRKLARRVREVFPGTGTRTYVDTGPVLERELAARAGLGATGKNTCLLSREHGSWFLLGELFTTLDLAPSAPEPLADLCGRCTRCLEACPTGALPEPYRLDANRCISYWTIEHRGAIPEAVRPALGDWVFGCDVCQEVCPWNLRFDERADRGGRAPADHPDLRLPAHRAELDLAGLLGLDRAGYEARFRGSAMQRARLEGLKRNAAIAMGNRGDPRYVPALERAAAREADPVVREAAAWALARIRGSAARPPEVGSGASS